MWLITPVSTRSIRPTKPMSSPPGPSIVDTRNSCPSSPESPTAGCPWRLMRDTMSLLTLTTSTILATSTVSAWLTRSPPTNSTGMSSRFMYAVMSGPPPCTTIGFSPTYFRSTTSRAKSSRSAGSVMAAPPYLMTTVLPWNSRMYGSASSSVPMSRISEGPLGRVVRVDGHVVVREVGEEDLGLGALAGEAHGVLDLGSAHRLRERDGVVGD